VFFAFPATVKITPPLNSALKPPNIATIMVKNFLWPSVRKRRSEVPQSGTTFPFGPFAKKSWKTEASTSKPHRPTSRASFYFMKLTCSNKDDILTHTVVAALLITAFLLLSMGLYLFSDSPSNVRWMEEIRKAQRMHR